MKQPLSLLVIFSLLFASCKKDNPPTPAKPDETKPDKGIEAVSDSVSFTVNGVVYNGNTVSTGHFIGNAGVDQKLVFPDPANPRNFEIEPNPDSVMFFKTNNIYAQNMSFEVNFLKKYAKANMVKLWGIMYNVPTAEELLTMFTIGKHPYAEDFGREQIMNGITIKVYLDRNTYVSNNPYPYQKPSKLEKGFQKGNFEIVSLVKNKEGSYNLEAKFDAQLFREFEGSQIKAENGYLRLNIR